MRYGADDEGRPRSRRSTDGARSQSSVHHNALLLALDDLDDIAELLTWLVDVLGDKSWEQGAR